MSTFCSGTTEPLSIPTIGGHKQLALRVIDTIAKRLRTESAEHDAVWRADARAREHRDRQLGHERHVNRDAVALLDAERFQNVRKRADLAIEIEVGQRPAIAGLTFPDDGGFVAARGSDMAIDAVDRRIDLPADKPLRVRRVRPVEDLRPFAAPLELGRKLRPEPFVVALGFFVRAGVADIGCRAELG